METLPLTLVIISAFMHAAWNLAAKKQQRKRSFFRTMLGFVAAAGFLPAVISEISANSIPREAWIFVAASGFFCGSYFYFLARSYESSDFTVAYPVARALPVLLVAAGDAARGRAFTPGSAMGLLMVAAGCLLLPLESFREIRLRKYFNRGSLFMLLTAAGTVGYSLLDKIASERVAPGHASALRYGYFFYLFGFLSYSLFSAAGKTAGNDTRSFTTAPVICGSVSFLSYGLILWAYQLTEHASYVVAFRQLSILLGIVTGLQMFREKGIATRLAGGCLLMGGLVLISLRG